MDFIWQSLAEFISATFSVSPFWYWCGAGTLVIMAGIALAWFFPPVRSLAGAVVMAVIAALYAYRRGEKDAQAHQEMEERRRVERRQTWW